MPAMHELLQGNESTDDTFKVETNLLSLECQIDEAEACTCVPSFFLSACAKSRSHSNRGFITVSALEMRWALAATSCEDSYALLGTNLLGHFNLIYKSGMPLDRDEYSVTNFRNMDDLSSNSRDGVSNSATRPENTKN